MWLWPIEICQCIEDRPVRNLIVETLSGKVIQDGLEPLQALYLAMNIGDVLFG
jgi:hypothetical protein